MAASGGPVTVEATGDGEVVSIAHALTSSGMVRSPLIGAVLLLGLLVTQLLIFIHNKPAI